MIVYHQPYDLHKNIGEYYNAAMAPLAPGDWCCFTDADAVFTTPNYGSQVAEILSARAEPEGYGLLYAVTNRIGCDWQLASCVDRSVDDMAYHRRMGKERQDEHGITVREVTGKQRGGSGFLILVRKDAWAKAGGFKESGMLGVDWAFFESAKKAGVRVGLMPGVYLYHWYRGGNQADTSHLT